MSKIIEDRKKLAKMLYQTALIRGAFTLRSGLKANEYFDKYRIESDPLLLRSVAKMMSKLIPANTQILAGLEMGGIPVATAMSLESDLPSVFVRKKAKEYGTCRFAEGIESLKGKRVLIVEDVITTGGQVILSCEDLRSEGAVVEDVVCIISREQGGEQILQQAGLRLHRLFTLNELKN